MKKVYEKPMLYAESYELVEHVAGGCALDGMNSPTHRDLDHCGFRVNGKSGAIAFQNAAVCEGWIDPFFGQPIDDVFCYNTFLDTAAMFAS